MHSFMIRECILGWNLGQRHGWMACGEIRLRCGLISSREVVWRDVKEPLKVTLSGCISWLSLPSPPSNISISSVHCTRCPVEIPRIFPFSKVNSQHASSFKTGLRCLITFALHKHFNYVTTILTIS